MQKNEPIEIMYDGNCTKWWIYKDAIYYETDNLDASAIKALVFEKENRKSKKIEKAKLIMENAVEFQTPLRREIIPDDVKVYVWNRDGGKCVRCGNNKNLEFDHIIPVSKGGSSSARNLQLLCEACNRSKGANLF